MKNNYSADFEIIWSERPKRAGGNPKLKASKAFSARLKDGHTTREILEGIRRYATFCGHTNKLGTEFVMQMATFLGPDEHFLETWELPVDQQKPEWSKLPFNNDELWPFAKRHGFSDPGASDYRQYRQKLQREIDVRLQQGATYATNN